MARTAPPVGDLLPEWRQRRLSQLELACQADISTKLRCLVETGRSAPSREMVLHLAECPQVPLRERNVLLAAAVYAPVYQDRPFTDPALAAAREAVNLVLHGHEPYPALAVDRRTISQRQRAAVRPTDAPSRRRSTRCDDSSVDCEENGDGI